jgi:hypothetical protein
VGAGTSVGSGVAVAQAAANSETSRPSAIKLIHLLLVIYSSSGFWNGLSIAQIETMYDGLLLGMFFSPHLLGL